MAADLRRQGWRYQKGRALRATDRTLQATRDGTEQAQTDGDLLDAAYFQSLVPDADAAALEELEEMIS